MNLEMLYSWGIFLSRNIHKNLINLKQCINNSEHNDKHDIYSQFSCFIHRNQICLKMSDVVPACPLPCSLTLCKVTKK